jgi:uncharacterized protein (DUF58 family)
VARRVSNALGSALRHDFAPEFSRKVRRFVSSPLGVLLLGVGVSALAGLVVHPRVFALAGGLLAVVAAGVCWPWLTARGVRAAVGFDRRRAVEGEAVAVSAEVTNHLPWPAWGLVVRSGGQAVRVPAVGGRSAAVCGWAFTPPRRGEYPMPPPTAGTGFPFGLWEASRRCEVTSTLVVWPRTLPVGPVPTSDGADVAEGNVTRSKVGSTGDVLGVRPYRRGDSPRRVHWAQSAKHDRLIVCELQSHSRPVVLLVLDADPAAHTPGDDGSREWAVRVTASLARGWLGAGAQVGLAVAGVFVPPNAGGEHLNALLDALARLGDTGVSLVDVLADPRATADTTAVRVVVTSDAVRASAADGRDVRRVVLDRAGFGGSPAHTADRTGVWLHIPSAADAPHQLRHGTPEASHGS